MQEVERGLVEVKIKSRPYVTGYRTRHTRNCVCFTPIAVFESYCYFLHLNCIRSPVPMAVSDFLCPIGVKCGEIKDIGQVGRWKAGLEPLLCCSKRSPVLFHIWIAISLGLAMQLFCFLVRGIRRIVGERHRRKVTDTNMRTSSASLSFRPTRFPYSFLFLLSL